MKRIFHQVSKILIVACLTVGVFLTVKKTVVEKDRQKSFTHQKSVVLKKYLVGHKKPQRIEIFNYTKKYEADVSELKKLKIPQDPNSDFYATIQFFTDESDSEAPLIAQIRFIDIKTNNTIKEESLNLE